MNGEPQAEAVAGAVADVGTFLPDVGSIASDRARARRRGRVIDLRDAPPRGAATLLRHAELQVQASIEALELLRDHVPTLVRWAQGLVHVLGGGGRLLVAGNGGSAAHAQHLTSELVGRFCSDRPAYSALCLSSESSSVTAIANDFGFERTFSRQVEAHARAGDVLLALSTSGRSPNLLLAALTARERGVHVWALTGPRPNPLADAADDVVGVAATSTASVQDAHQVAVHVLCATFDAAMGPAS